MEALPRARGRRACVHARADRALRTTLAVAALAVALLLASAWQLAPVADAAFVGRPSPGSGGSTYNPAAELMYGNGTLHVTWTDVNGGDAKASTWGGTSWTALPDVGPGGGGRRTDPSLAWGGSLLWGVLNDGTDEPRVKYFSGGTWTLIPDPTVPNSGTWSTPSLAHDGTLLWAAWQDAGRIVRVSTWNGTSWTSRTSPGGGSGNAYPDLEYNEVTGTMWITFNQGGYAPVHEWVAGAWASRGSVGDGAGNKVPGMTDVNGTMLISWDDAPNHEVRTQMRLGTTWYEVDSHRPTTSANFSYPDLAWTGSGLWATNTDGATSMSIEAWEWDGAPLSPVNLVQLRDDATTVIAAGATTTDGVSTNVNLRFSMVSVLGGQTAVPWIEIRSSATAFSASCGSTVAGATFSGTSVALTSAGQAYTATVPVTGLASGVEYHWRACARTGTLSSAWRGDSTNQRFTVSAPPVAPSAMFAGDLSAATGTTNSTTITNDDFQLSWRNDASTSVDRQRVQLVTTPLTDVVGLWHLDGNTNDGSGGGNAAALGAGASTPTYGSTKAGFGQALWFDGDDRATLPSSSSLDLDQFTVEAWFNVGTGGADYETLFEKTNGGSSPTQRNLTLHTCPTYGCGGGAAGRVEATITTDAGANQISAASTTTLLDGGWHHVAVTSGGTGGRLRLYVNGVLEGDAAIVGNVDNPSSAFELGQRAAAAAHRLSGAIDDLRISSRERTQAELVGAIRTRRPHNVVLWDSDATDAGVALGASCAAAARCADVTYGSSGTAIPLVYDQARYYARAKLRTASTGTWSGWSSWDWFETMNSTTLSAGGCTGIALTFGTIVAGIPSITTGDCVVGFGSTGTSTQLRIYQTDQAGTAAGGAGAAPGTGTIDDYAAGVSDMDQGPSMFGACLRAVTNATADWSVNASCPSTDGAHWNAVPASPGVAAANVVHTTGAEPAAEARLRFAVRVDGSIAAGGYAAPITIEVVDPTL